MRWRKRRKRSRRRKRRGRRRRLRKSMTAKEVKPLLKEKPTRCVYLVDSGITAETFLLNDLKFNKTG